MRSTSDCSWKSYVNPRYPILFSVKDYADMSLRHSICPKSVLCPNILMKRSFATFLGRYSSSPFCFIQEINETRPLLSIYNTLKDSRIKAFSIYTNDLSSAAVLQFLIDLIKSLNLLGISLPI